MAVLLLVQCGLPQHLINEAELSKVRIDDESRRIDGLARQFEEFKESPEYSVFGRYAEREDWERYITAARAKLESAERLYREQMVPLVEEDDSNRVEALSEALKKTTALLAGTHESARQWIDRRDFLAKVAETADAMLDECQESVGEMDAIEEQLTETTEQVRSDHPTRIEDIDRIVEPLEELRGSTRAALANAVAERGNRGSDSGFDLATFGDACQLAGQQAQEYVERAPEITARLAELNRGYSRTLVDMKTEHDLVVRRESWNNALDYPRVHAIDYRVANVDLPTFEHLVGIRGSLARYSRTILGRRLSLLSGTEAQHWNALGIDPLANWPGRDSHAEYWVQGTESRYFHKYLVLENGSTRELDWMKVSEDFFFANIDNLGMDVESKPYGSFESEKLTQAAPPGMAFVGNPHYGRWTSDGSGGSVWTWMGPYLLYSSMFGSPMRYGRSDWDTWHGGYRGRRPYYGGSVQTPRWGTRSQTTRTSPRMQRSTFARGGGFRRPPSTVRGAGPSSRRTWFGGSGK